MANDEKVLAIEVLLVSDAAQRCRSVLKRVRGRGRGPSPAIAIAASSLTKICWPKPYHKDWWQSDVYDDLMKRANYDNLTAIASSDG
jgi:hypothetical protein